MKKILFSLYTLVFTATLLVGFTSAKAQSVEDNNADVCVDDGCTVVQHNRVFIVSTGTNTDDLIGIAKDAASATNALSKRRASWNFGPSSQILAVSHKGDNISYGLLGVYGVRSTKSTLVQLSGGIGKDTSGQIGIGAQLIAGFKVGGYTALGLGIVAADSVDQRGNKDEEVLKLRSLGAGPSITMQLGPVNMAIAVGVAWSGKPINGRSVDGVLVEEPGRSYAFGPFGTVSLTLGLRGLLK